MKPEAEGARPKPAVCRRLFADEEADEEGIRDNMFNRITEQINRNLDDACKKYNFDFRNEVPLEGDWTWERISPEGEDLEGSGVPAVEGSKESAPQPPASEPPAPPTDPPQPPTVPQ